MTPIQLTLEQKRALINYYLHRENKGIFEDRLELWPGLAENDELYRPYRDAASQFVDSIRQDALAKLEPPVASPADPTLQPLGTSTPLFKKELIDSRMSYWHSSSLFEIWPKIELDDISPTVVVLDKPSSSNNLEVVALGHCRGKTHVLGLYNNHTIESTHRIVGLVQSTLGCYVATDIAGAGEIFARRLLSDFRLPADRLIRTRFHLKPGSAVYRVDNYMLNINKLVALEDLASDMRQGLLWLPKACKEAYDLLNYHKLSQTGTEVAQRVIVDDNTARFANLLVTGMATLLAIRNDDNPNLGS